MNVLIVSQCSKNASKTSRQILDQFAERCGDRTWATSITMEGVNTLRKLLKQSARRNTAVACHWVRGKGRFELMWIVGNASKFNAEGAVPTNTTSQDVLKVGFENDWQTGKSVSLLAQLAALFHDFGKANTLFQRKLKPKFKGKRFEPCRHEWVSLRLFQAFVGDRTDEEWLERLAAVTPGMDVELQVELVSRALREGLEPGTCPFSKWQPGPVGKAVAWLILSHHLLPAFPKKGREGGPKSRKIDGWIQQMDATWNSPQMKSSPEPWEDSDWDALWEFRHGTPMRSKQWCRSAQAIARQALAHNQLFNSDWFEDRYSLHIARMALMLADHLYSASDATPSWQDPDFPCIANTVRETNEPRQKLDEHLLGVKKYARDAARLLPMVSDQLPSLSKDVRALKKRASDSRFLWQDKAFDVAKSLSQRSLENGFFGINMASTGCGKTFANARIMYGLSQDSKRCRFSVALGLCSLTLQTGEAIKERLGTHSEDVAVLIGSRAFQELYEQRTSDEISTGSESEEDLFEDAFYIRYEGALGDGPFSRWLKQKPKLNQLVSAPILVSTIDYLVPATEGARGGKQIAPMLRLLSSDLVLDEPDDFGLEDLPALCRLVNWAGMLGSRVLLSSATMPPALALALYEAYQSGRNAYNHSRGLERLAKPVPCLWVDEFRSVVHEPTGSEDFKCLHVAFVDKRVAKLTENEKPARRGAVVPIEKMPSTKGSLSEAAAIVAEAVHKEMLSLHDEHHEKDPVSGKKVSFGLVRMANINPMVAMVRSLLHHSLPDGVRVHFCVYHSQFPLIMRSAIESKIDVALDRRDPQAIWRNPTIKRALDQHPEENHLFVVFGTAVTEVGRDHDYDWAIAEPSSMRSLIQLAGRLQRHRQREPGTANLRILDRNVRALRSRDVCFTKPGFESEGDFSLASHKVSDLLNPDQYQVLNAIPRIQVDPDLSPTQNLVALEHAHLEARLFEGVCPQYAALWWKHNPAWSFEFQRRTPFRHSRPQDTFILMKEEFGDAFHWHRVLRDSGLQACEGRFNRAELSFANGFSPWVSMDVYELLDALTSTEAEECDQTEWIRLCWRFTPVQLAPYEDLGERRFDFHPLLGVYLED